MEKEMLIVAFYQSLGTLSSQYVILDLSGDDSLYPDIYSISIDLLRKAPYAAFVYSWRLYF